MTPTRVTGLIPKISRSRAPIFSCCSLGCSPFGADPSPGCNKARVRNSGLPVFLPCVGFNLGFDDLGLSKACTQSQ